ETAFLYRRIRAEDEDRQRRRPRRRRRGHRSAGTAGRRSARHDWRRPHYGRQDHHAAAIRGAEDFSRLNPMRITLIHALKHSIVPIADSFARHWPDATLMNLVDDSLSMDLARDGRLTNAMTERFLSLGRYAASTGANAILFTCSAF